MIAMTIIIYELQWDNDNNEDFSRMLKAFVESVDNNDDGYYSNYAFNGCSIEQAVVCILEYNYKNHTDKNILIMYCGEIAGFGTIVAVILGWV